MLGPILFLSINTSANLINKKVTAFGWVPDSDSTYKGKCYEYDIETGGKAFQALTRKSKCRPESVEFIWVPSDKGSGGRCYEVDTETKGMKFAIGASGENCVSQDVRYSWELSTEISGDCYQVDEKLRRKVSKGLCAPSKVEHHWIAKGSGWGGKCYAVDSLNGPSGYIESVGTENCRPEEVAYILHARTPSARGYCYEVDPNLGAKAYSRRVSRSNCLSKKPAEYLWQQNVNGLSGECTEVKKTVVETISSRKVDYKKCIDFETKIFFKRLSSYRGICLLIDDLTQGRKFTQTITLSNCRDMVEKFDYLIIANEYGKPICVESDSKTGGNNFVQKVSLASCEETKKKPKWVLDDDGWSGKCMEVRTLGEKVRERSIRKENCRPEKTRIIWHNFKKLDGKCFEVHAEIGVNGFVVETDLNKCRPKFTKYIFYREEGKRAGNCYLVDRETNGEKFNKIVGTTKCRNNLIKVP